MLNKVMLIGRLTADPIGRYTQSGVHVATFSLAVNRVFNSPDGIRKESTDFFNIVAWRDLAEQVTRFLSKGRLVYVEGRLQTRSYETSTGEKRRVSEVVASTVLFLEKRETEGVQPLESAGEVEEILESVFKEEDDEVRGMNK